VPFGIKFDPKAFANEFVSRRVGRQLGEFLDDLGMDTLTYLVENNRDLSDFIPWEKQQQILKGMSSFGEIARMFSNGEIYTWMPERYRRFFEQKPDGQKWALKQIGFIRQAL